MDKYQKLIVGLVIAVVLAALIYVFVVFNEFGNMSPGSDNTRFPYFIFFPIGVAIFIPIIVQKRQEAKMKEEELKNQLGES